MSALVRQRAQTVPHLRDISLARLKKLWTNVGTKPGTKYNLKKPCTEWSLLRHGDLRAHVGTKWNQGGTKHRKTHKLGVKTVSSCKWPRLSHSRNQVEPSSEPS